MVREKACPWLLCKSVFKKSRSRLRTIRCPFLSVHAPTAGVQAFVKDRGFAKATTLAAHSDLSAMLIVARTPQHTRCVCCCRATVACKRYKASAHRCATRAKQARHSGGRGRASQALPHGAAERRFGVGGVSPRGSQEPLEGMGMGPIPAVAVGRQAGLRREADAAAPGGKPRPPAEGNHQRGRGISPRSRFRAWPGSGCFGGRGGVHLGGLARLRRG